jgi:hypothetical protein
MTDDRYRPVLPVIKIGNAIYATSPCELFEAYLELLSSDRESFVMCHVHAVGDFKEAILLSARLGSFYASVEPEVARLKSLRLMIEAGIGRHEINMAYGADTPAGARLLGRDYAIARFPQLLARLPGYKDEKHKPTDNPIPYSLMAQAVQKMRSDESCVSEFLKRYDEEMDLLRRKGTRPDGESSKPIYRWREYNRRAVLRIAENVALNRGYLKQNIKDLEDIKLQPYFDRDTGDYHLPVPKFNVYDTSLRNQKTLVAVGYFYIRIGQTVLSHMRRICPAEHGDYQRSDMALLEDLLPQLSNLPKVEDLSYIDHIYEFRWLTAADREHFLRCLGINAGDFGFGSYDPYATSSYSLAMNTFGSFLNRFKLHNDIETIDSLRKHPAGRYYDLIMEILSARAGNSDAIAWHEFFNQVFTYVMKEMRRERENRRTHVKNLAESLDDLKLHSTSQIDEALAVRGKVRLSRSQLESYVQERLHQSQQGLRGTLSLAVRSMEAIATDAVDIAVRKKVGVTTNLQDLLDGSPDRKPTR